MKKLRIALLRSAAQWPRMHKTPIRSAYRLP